MENLERFSEYSRKADRIAGNLAIAFLAFVAGSLFGYLWMSHAYGLWQ